MTDAGADIIYLALGMAFGALLFNLGRLSAMQDAYRLQAPLIKVLKDFFDWIQSQLKGDKK